MAPRAYLPRRNFLKLAGAVAVTAQTSVSGFALSRQAIYLVVDQRDPLIGSTPVMRALARLQKALTGKGVDSVTVASADLIKNASRVILISGPAKAVKGFPPAGASATHPECVRIVAGKIADVDALWVSSPGALGLVYGLMELGDRVESSSDSSLGLHLTSPIEEVPANQVRSAARAFCSETEDKPWYYSKTFWQGYLDTLVSSRFNRFNFAFGFGYDFPKGVTGDYFHFPFPYLVAVPGYDVRVVPLETGERERNMAMLRFIAQETAARGLQFQLGIWTLAYEWTDSPKAHHHIEGLNAGNHAAYTRDALAIILKECPEISGLTMRVHGESGIPEGSYDYWRTVFQAVKGCGRPVEIDMHAKGINQIMIDMAKETGMPIKIGAKSWAEHMGLGYHQTDIRELEIPTPARMESGLFNVSNGERRFTRYGYADLLQEGRPYNVLFRLWPGTQRHLLWGDPEMAAAYSRTASFCGAAGLEICEPLTFKGREGTGTTGGRCAYIDKTLEPSDDWEKFAYTYRLWGRMLYNPETSPEVWQRSLSQHFGSGAAAAETAMSNASRVLPLITTAHLPSASNHSYWPELYTNMPITPGGHSPYSDTPKPARFGTVSPLDPQVFSSIDEYVASLAKGSADPKYSPLDVAGWLERFTATSSRAATALRKDALRTSSPNFRRWEEDLLIQIGLGRFFAAKLRSGVAFEIFLCSGDVAAGQMAVAKYTEARDAWTTMAKRAAGVYRSDITYGEIAQRRGHWLDRLPAIEDDLATMREALKTPPTARGGSLNVSAALKLVAATPPRPKLGVRHYPEKIFTPGKELKVSLADASLVESAELFYRHVNQGERWKSTAMTKISNGYTASIPAAYTQSVYPLQYYFVLQHGKASAYHPEFNETLSNQPYFAIWHRG